MIIASASLKRSFAALVAGYGFLIALIVAVFWFVHLQDDATAAAGSLVSTQQALMRVYARVDDAESGQRAFLLTGNERFLDPYNRAVASVDDDFRTLVEQMNALGRPHDDVLALRRDVDVKLEELRHVDAIQRAGEHEAAVAALRVDDVRVSMDRIRAIVAEILQHQRSHYEAIALTANEAGRWLSAVALLAVVFAALLTAWALFQSRRQILRLVAAEAETKLANASLLAEAQRREKLSEQLRQSQKMDAIGQLTGGVAHDFNNMLAVIMGSLSLMKRRMQKGDTDVGRFVDGALDGAQRAADLTHRLLAFARQQPLAPLAFDANRMVGEMAEILHRTIGEQIRLETVLAQGLWLVNVDQGELGNSILNLAVNARDAMPSGGRLTIETANVSFSDEFPDEHMGIPSGQYVLLGVSDTGVGMGPDILRNAFDPFFTTKPMGRGTGLGLSQVYGFVRQSGGHVKVYSEIGHGTSVKLYLPRYVGEEGAQRSELLAASESPRGHAGEVILVVEDDARVRLIAVESLRELGYTVLHADGAAAALRHLETRAVVSLLFTDIVMPDMNGRRLVDEALARREGLKVLYTTGYTRNAIVHNGVLDPGVEMIGKPYSIEELARKVREILDRK